MGNPVDLAKWLYDEMNRQGLTVSDVATLGNISAPTISRILNMERNAGPDACVAIAKALNYPPEMVFRIAGLLPDTTVAPHSPEAQELTHLFDQLSDDDQRDILIMIRALVREKVRSYGRNPQARPSES